MSILYHNPRCSKSRDAVALCEASMNDVEIHFYLTNPLDYETLHSLLTRLDGELYLAVRWKDKAFKDMANPHVDRTSIDSIARFLTNNGHLMERPWLDNGFSTRIGRPVESLIDFLQ
jgi:arsenate reductase